MATGAGTNGGASGMNGAQRRLALLLGCGFLVILIVIMFANASSMVSDFAAAHIPVTPAHIWLFEASSIAAWITEMPLIWLLVAYLWRARRSWWITALIVGALSIPFSLWHIGLMVAIRDAVYAVQGEHYRFNVGGENPVLYEYRKDLGTFLQFAGLALLAQWLLARTASVPDARPRTLAVNDGAVTHHVPLTEIERVASAGNYVEIVWGERMLLQRATLAAVAEELGAAFVRIHRGQLVRRDAVRRVETDKSGDFTVTLGSGATVRGSRRYRTAVETGYISGEP